MWINGPFGVGKLALAADLVQALPGAVVADPEDTGSAVRSALRGHPREHRDYQLYPPWVTTTVCFISSLTRTPRA